MKDAMILQMIKSGDFDALRKVIEMLKEAEKISDKVLATILACDDKLFVGDFLESFIWFSDKQLKIVEDYIFQHLNERNALFLNCLIECANANRILSLYYPCLKIICTRRNGIVVMAALDFIFENIRLDEIKEVVRVFRKVLNNKSYYQNSQTLAALYLFRLTGQEEYYDFLRELVLVLGTLNDFNYNVLKNCLAQTECFHPKYFSAHDRLMDIIHEKERLG